MKSSIVNRQFEWPMSSTVAGIFTKPKPIIGMLHVPPLPGSPRYGGDVTAIEDFVLRDAAALVDGGVDGLLMENFGDDPFYPSRVPATTVAQMSALAAGVRRRFDVPLGINVLRNDGRAALAIAHAVGGRFVRVNVLCGARITDQGIVHGIAHDLLRDRHQLGAAGVMIFADINVKHSAPLAPRPIAEEARDTVERGGADALIVSGGRTGQATDVAELRAVRDASQHTPVFVGSGITAETLAAYLSFADGFIVGTSLKRDGMIHNPVDPDRVRALVEQLARATA